MVSYGEVNKCQVPLRIGVDVCEVASFEFLQDRSSSLPKHRTNHKVENRTHHPSSSKIRRRRSVWASQITFGGERKKKVSTL